MAPAGRRRDPGRGTRTRCTAPAARNRTRRAPPATRRRPPLRRSSASRPRPPPRTTRVRRDEAGRRAAPDAPRSRVSPVGAAMPRPHSVAVQPEAALPRLAVQPPREVADVRLHARALERPKLLLERLHAPQVLAGLVWSRAYAHGIPAARRCASCRPDELARRALLYG